MPGYGAMLKKVVGKKSRKSRRGKKGKKKSKRTQKEVEK